MINSLELIFWCAFSVLLYSYAGYPVLVFIASRFFPPRERQRSPFDSTELPRITVLIVAYNAQQHILDRVRNILDSSYPQDRLDILVASDGSTDATVSLVQGLGHPRVRALACSERRGKTKTLVDAVRQVNSGVILFTDATNHFDRDSILRLAGNFVDPHIGIATGKVSLIDERGAPVESAYWKMEMLLRRCEMRLGVMLGANGPIYAIRRELFVEPECPIINDDLVLPMLAHLRHGCGIVYDETARAYMLSSGGLVSEFRRRCRIGTGAFQSLPALYDLFQPQHATQAIAFVSHKLMRWIGPFMLVLMLGANLALSMHPGYRMLLTIQLAAYLLAVVGLFVPNRGRPARLARAAASFLVMNLALLTGFFRWVRQPQIVVWNPTARPALGEISAFRPRSSP